MSDQTKIIACVPVNVEPIKELMGLTVVEPPPDSVIMKCDLCEQAIHVGPKQAEFLEDFPDTPKLCWVCAVITSRGVSPGDTDVKHLGGKGGTYK